jgi:hypothetical protein
LALEYNSISYLLFNSFFVIQMKFQLITMNHSEADQSTDTPSTKELAQVESLLLAKHGVEEEVLIGMRIDALADKTSTEVQQEIVRLQREAL